MQRLLKYSDLTELRARLAAQEPERTVLVSRGTCGMARGAAQLIEALRHELARAQTNGQVRLRLTGCLG